MIVPVAVHVPDVEANVPTEAVEALSEVVLQAELYSKRNFCDQLHCDVICVFLCILVFCVIFGLILFEKLLSH